MIVSVLAICLIGFGFFSYRNKARSHANPSSGTNLSRVKGKIKWFNEAKGYGFIAKEDGTDVFVDTSAIKGLHEGDEVEFEIVRGPKGQMAENVVKVAGSSH